MNLKKLILIACPLLAINGAAASTESLVWRGDQATARGFVTDMAKQYESQKHAKLTLQPFSTISGLDAVNLGSADMAGSARPAMPSRTEESSLVFHPIAYDALVAITSPKNAAGGLTLQQLRDIYLGKIINWKEIGGADVPINVYAVAGPLDGIEYSARLLLFKNGDQRVAAPRLYINTEKLEEAIAIDPAGLGLSSLSAVYANKAVKVLAIENVAASYASIADSTYPLYFPLYLVTRKDGARAAKTQEFVDFAQTPKVQEALHRHQLVPYDGELEARQSQQLAYLDTHLFHAKAPSLEQSVAATPVAAPNATLAAKMAIAPTAPSTLEARKRAEKANAGKIEKKP